MPKIIKIRSWRKMKVNILFFCILNFLPIWTISQNLMSPRTIEWKSENDRGNRYEGDFSQSYGRSDIKLLGITSDQTKNHLDTIKNASIYFYSPKYFDLFLKAEELDPIHYYWMEAKDSQCEGGKNEFGPWPWTEVLQWYNISYSNLGILIQVFPKAREGKYFLPAHIVETKFKGTFPYAQYKIDFFFGKNIGSGMIQFYKGIINTESLREKFSEQTFSYIHRGNSRSFFLNKEEILYYKGWVTIGVKLRLENHQYYRATEYFYFYHNGWELFINQ